MCAETWTQGCLPINETFAQAQEQVVYVASNNQALGAVIGLRHLKLLEEALGSEFIMRIQLPKVISLVAALALPTTLYAQLSMRARALIDSLGHAHACGPVTRFPPSGLELPPVGASDTLRRCALIRTAKDYVARGRAMTLGVAPADTALIRSVLVTPFAFRKIDESPGDQYWSVDLAMPSKNYILVVQIDQRTGVIRAGRGDSF